MVQKEQEPVVKNGFITTVYHMDWNTGKMVPTKTTILDVGQKVFLRGPYCRDAWFVCVSEPNENMVQKLVEIRGRHMSDVWECRCDDKSVHQQFGIGLYYDDSGERVSQAEIDKYIHDAEVQKRWNERLARIKAEKEAQKRADLRKKFAGILTPLDTVSNGEITKTEKANLLAYLSYRFPGTKFTAKKGYSSYTVKYTDGPAEDDVKTAANIFHDHTFNGYEDYNEYTPSQFNRLFGGFSYGCDVKRKLSEKAEQIIREEIAEKLPELDLENLQEEVSNSTLQKLGIKDFYHGHATVAEMIRWYGEQKTFETEKVAEPKTSEISGLEYVDYSEKAFAVIGDTKSVKDLLKKMGGRFNPKLSCGAGWIFSKKNEAEIRAKLGLA